MKKVVAKKSVTERSTSSNPAPRTTPTSGHTPKTTPTKKAVSTGKSGDRGGGGEKGEGGTGGKRRRGEGGEGGEVKKMKVTKEEEAPVDLTRYQNYPRLTRSAYRHIERLGHEDSATNTGQYCTIRYMYTCT